MPSFDDQYEVQSKLIYSIIVAGKSADFADNAVRKFLVAIAADAGCQHDKVLPFDMIQKLNPGQLLGATIRARTGNYGKISTACLELEQKLREGLDLMKCTPDELEKVHGIGPKTARFFILWTRPDEEYAALDVHVLRWLNQNGVSAPRSTPTQPTYARLEKKFIEMAKARGLTPRQLDSQIWEAGAGRTQETALPDASRVPPRSSSPSTLG